MSPTPRSRRRPPPAEATGRGAPEAVARAEAVCAGRGLRFTARRRRVLELVVDAGRPVGAYWVLERLRSARGEIKIDPPTVYRALEFLVEHGFVHRIESMNAFVACDEVEHPHSAQFAICRGCGAVTEIHDETIAGDLRQHGRRLGFRIERQIIELCGLCPQCRGDDG